MFQVVAVDRHPPSYFRFSGGSRRDQKVGRLHQELENMLKRNVYRGWRLYHDSRNCDLYRQPERYEN